MLENGLTQFMQFRQQQQQAAAAAAAQADLFARLGRPLPRLPLPLPLPFLHAHMAAAKSATNPFADNLRARFHGFAAAAAASTVAAAATAVSQHQNIPPPPPPPPPVAPVPHTPTALSLHPPMIPRTSPQNSSDNILTQMGQTSPSCRNPYNDEPMSPNGKLKSGAKKIA